MSKIRATGKLLAADAANRTLRYTLLPFGEVGNTSLGRVTASAHTITIPAEPLLVNEEHDPTKPLGTMVTEERENSLECEVTVLPTAAGDAALTAAASGKRSCISVEIDNPVIRAGKLLAGLLSGSGMVAKPAFPSSTLLAADAGEIMPELEAAAAAIEAGDLEAAAAAIAAAQAKANEDDETPTEKENEVPTNLSASAPANMAALLAGLTGTAGKAETPEPKLKASEGVTLAKFSEAVRLMHHGMGDPTLKAAAFEMISQADMYDPAAQPEYLGEVWGDVVYEERFAPLVSTANLTGMSVDGWRWEEGSEAIVDDWEPDGGTPEAPIRNDIPSSEMVLKPYSEKAKRIAGGNRFDRVHFDFPVPGVLESFLKNQAEYIKRRRDERVRQHIYTGAKQITGTGSDVASTWAKIILGAMHCMDYAKPTYAIVGNDLYRPMLATDMLENLALLETTLGLESGSMAGFRIQPASITDTASNGKVLVGASKATVLHQPAGAPFRVDSQELLKGAIDKAVFSYYLLRSDERGGIYEVKG